MNKISFAIALSFLIGVTVDHYIFTNDSVTNNYTVTPTVVVEVPPPIVEIDIEQIFQNQEPTEPHLDMEELECLAKNVYFEARGESTIGKIAVAHVTLNRVNSPRFPSTICGVVHQAVYSKWWYEEHGKLVPVRYKCQFTWFCDGKSDAINDMRAWQQSMAVAEDVMLDMTQDPTHGAKWYYNPRLADPKWQYSYVKTATVGNHKFMRSL